MSYFKNVFITDATSGSTAPIVPLPFTSGSALRVLGGPTDPISDIPVFLDMAHHQLHEGEAHQVTYAPAALSSGSNLDFRLVVGNLTATTKTPHIEIDLDATAETWLYLYETPSTSANGSQQTAYNRNRNSATTPNMTVWLGPTVTGVGTLISAWVVGSGNKSGGSTRDALEWGLKANTVYLVRATAKASLNICVRLKWYEDLGV